MPFCSGLRNWLNGCPHDLLVVTRIAVPQKKNAYQGRLRLTAIRLRLLSGFPATSWPQLVAGNDQDDFVVGTLEMHTTN